MIYSDANIVQEVYCVQTTY